MLWGGNFNGDDKLKFYEVQEALEKGKKIKSKKFGTFFLKDGYLYYEHETLIEFMQGFAIYVILADDWEIIEDIQEVTTQITLSETYTCPSCKTSDEYWPSQKEAVTELGYFSCGKCGQKIKPIVQTDEEIINYLKTELGREFTTPDLKNVLVEMSIHPPDIITLVNDKGVNIRFIKEK